MSILKISLNMKIYHLIIVLLVAQSSYSLGDISIKKDYGNVVVYSSQSVYSEELNKTLIIAQYAELIAKQYNYTDKIFLHFLEGHSEKIKINTLFYSKDESSENIGMNIFFQGSDFSVKGCLSVIDKSIANYGNLKKIQDSVNYLYDNPISKKVAEILHEKIYRPNEIDKLEKANKTYTYYFVDNKYHFIEINNKIETEIVVVDKVIDFSTFYNLLIVFTQKNELEIIKLKELIRTLKLENTDSYYRPYHISYMGGNKLFIEFNSYSKQNEHRIAMYDLVKDVFIQDLDNLIKN